MFGGGISMVDKKHLRHKYSGEEHNTFTEWFNESLNKKNKKTKVTCQKKDQNLEKNNNKLLINLLFGD